MDPKAFVRLSIGSLGLRDPIAASRSSKTEIDAPSSSWMCEIRLEAFKSNLKALLAPRRFHTSMAYLDVSVFKSRQGSITALVVKKQQIGTFKLKVSRDGWVDISKNKQESAKLAIELHLIVKLDPDPRYVFQFEDETTLSPQIVQLQGSIKQPIFSCKFSRDRRAPLLDPVNNYWKSSSGGSDQEIERRERKGWKVMIHDLSGCDRVARSNPGAWLIVRSDACGPESWQPWGKLEAWRERGLRDSICCRFHLLPEGGQDGGLLVSEMLISADKGGEFFIDTDRQTLAATPLPSPQSSGDFTSVGPVGEGKHSKPLVQLAMRHVTCVEDAAIFMALAAAVDLSIEACRPFSRKSGWGTNRHSF
ncbi:hypothetical protein MKW92_036832 [Papaver armeniacum]|nr:hypothetical protein MKW92_036832 [Papaver armeniacum]